MISDDLKLVTLKIVLSLFEAFYNCVELFRHNVLTALI
jgi:hypothetical protein